MSLCPAMDVKTEGQKEKGVAQGLTGLGEARAGTQTS